jgi:transcriptional regulator with PAS, ATPase and Fis domain
VDAASLCTVADPRASGRHARVHKTSGGFAVEDLGSKNGTWVNGRRIEDACPLRPGFWLMVGGTAAVFRLLARDEVAALVAEAATPFGPVASASPEFAVLLRKLKRLATTAQPLLLGGETGSGKEVYARAVHAHSGRPGPLLALNCAAMPGELLESELFGYAKGAHSQASQPKPGLIERAQGGTLFLDEIADMPALAQAKLLRFLQDREYMPLGSTVVRRADVRIVAASSQLDRPGKDGLREDLRGRLGAEPIVLPPLRHRPEDIGPLAAHFLGGSRAFTVSAFLALQSYPWPRNVRELESTVAAAAAVAEPGEPIELSQLPVAVRETVRRAPDEAPGAERRRSPRPPPDRAELERLLQEHAGNVAQLAKVLDRQWAVVHRWIERFGLDVERHRR